MIQEAEHLPHLREFNCISLLTAEKAKLIKKTSFGRVFCIVFYSHIKIL